MTDFSGLVPMNLLVIDPSIEYPEDEAFDLIQKISTTQSNIDGKTRVVSRILPGLEKYEIGSPDMIFLLGSKANVEDDFPWIDTLSCQLLKLCFQAGIPTLGICFGHQLLSYLAGATVGDFATPVEVKTERMVRCIHPKFGTLLREPEVPTTFRSVALHGQEVKNIPTGFFHSCTSDDCFYEGFTHVDKPIYTLQTHPEFGTTHGSHIIQNFIRGSLKIAKVEA
jgi:GMP synthase-like glutamine amidotransferase